MKTNKIFIIAGESSGDNLGRKLCHCLKKEAKCEFLGIGGEGMKSEGLRTIFPMEELSLFGFTEIFFKIPNILRRIRFTIKQIRKYDPDFIITIDSPGFCFRVIKKVADLRARKIHYVAPSIWIKPERVKFLEKYYDKVLTLLPFEKKFFKKSKLKCIFVGHPVVEDNFDHKNKDSIRGRYSIEKDDVLITAMLGSRESEVERMGVTFIDALNRVYRSIDKKLVVAFPYVSENTKLSIEKIAKRATFDFFFCNQSEKKNIFVASDFALVKSGTSSLELAVAKVPMVVAYKVSWLSALIARYIIGLKGYISIINILAKKQIIPEFIQDKCNAENLSVALLNLMHKDSKRQISLVQREIAKLRANKTTPSQEAAKAVFD